ncbi:MAG: secondary thiamine-phosphate synthase enzyme YjbQ [Bryobacteraceae bacterium]|jgi:secondary thiamine-phosphate synthase enzyme
MNSHNGSSAAAAKAAEAPVAAPSPSFKVFHRVVDWITNDRMQLINITDRINDIVRKSGVRDGIVHLQSLHTTTAVFLNEWQDALLADVRAVLEELIRRDGNWRHNDPRYSDCDRSNADSHLRGMLLGQALSLQVRNSAVLLGTWQSIILAEFDGPRSRTMSVQVSGI